MNVTATFERVFHQATELAAGRERAAYLESACGGNKCLQREIESLLTAHSGAHNFLRSPSDRSLDPDDLLSNSLPGYELQELIGVGGMGQVYRARQLALHRDVAIKILPMDLSRFESFRQRFKVEALAMAQLVHPNLIGIHDFGSVDGLLYLVMEFVDGSPLDQAAGGRAIDPRQAIEIVAAVASGLEHAHQQGILHRDIKPSNIFITSDFDAKLGDFGLAVPVDNVSSGMPMGTPGYLAPEVLDDFQSATPASDVYSLGLILHQLLTGVSPTRAAHPDLHLVPGLRGLQPLVSKALALQAQARFSSGGDMKVALLSWLDEARRVSPRLLTGPSATSIAYSPFPARPARTIKTFRPDAGAMAAASITLLLVAITAITLSLHGPDHTPDIVSKNPPPSSSLETLSRNVTPFVPMESRSPSFDLDAPEHDTHDELRKPASDREPGDRDPIKAAGPTTKKAPLNWK